MNQFSPHPYQQRAINAILDQPSVGLFLGMGLGKTVITLTALDRLIFDSFEVSQVLVIAPKIVAEQTWQQEAGQWAHLGRLDFSLVLGTEQKRLEALAHPARIKVINRENVAWLVHRYENNWPFDCVVIDELSSFKNPSAQRFKALKAVRPKIKKVIGLTGTPAPNGYMDLWAQVYLLDQGEALGKTITSYRQAYFDQDSYTYGYTIKKGASKEIDSRLAGLCLSMTEKDYLALPDLTVKDCPIDLPEEAKKAYKQLERALFLELGDTEVTTLNAAALSNKLLQLAGGALYTDTGEGKVIHRAKLDRLLSLVERLEGEPALLFYQYKHEAERILAELSKLNIKVKELSEKGAIEAWNNGEVDILLAHPASAAYGLNLQSGGRVLIWYTLPWSLELYEQANKRLHRQGQKKAVTVYRLLTRGTRDEDVALALAHKGNAQAQLLESLKARRASYLQGV